MGTYPDTSLADARKRRDEARQKIEAGTDPGAERRLTEGAPERTFEAVAQHYLAGMERKVLLKKRSPATLRKARWALRDYVFPFVGANPIDSISSQELLAVLKKIESRQALAVVRELLAMPIESRLLFPALGHPERPMSENTVGKRWRIMGYSTGDMSAHGFRSLASTLLNELGWPPDAIEKQLAHIEEEEVAQPPCWAQSPLPLIARRTPIACFQARAPLSAAAASQSRRYLGQRDVGAQHLE
jgi:hypothetical protein